MRITTYGLKLEKDLTNSLVKEDAYNYPTMNNLNNPEYIVKMMNAIFHLNEKAEEYSYLLCFDIKCNLIGVFELSHGNVNLSILSRRSIFIRAILCAAVSIVLVHNHPSGDAMPSEADIKATRCVKEAGELMEIPLLDHIIIGSNGNHYVSMYEQKMM